MSAHHCHAIGCSAPVPPKMLMCLKHWRMVPRANQRTIWATYRPGQEDDKRPSLLYLLNQRLACAAVAEKEGLHAEAREAREQAARIAEQLLAAGKDVPAVPLRQGSLFDTPSSRRKP